ncbi:MAG TPA: DUF2795 domain-containing protein [Alphaproteobacteria bacterium]
MADGNILNYIGSNVVFPITKETLKAEAEANGADEQMLDAIDKISSDHFHSYSDVSTEFSAA